jgi:hypothetical protein
MPYRYVLKWTRETNEKICVEAWPKTVDVALEGEMKRPSFVIGKLQGSRVIMLRQLVDEAIKTYGSKKRHLTVRVDFPKDDVQAIAVAYRLGLLAAVLSKIENEESLEHAYQYLMRATQEEIWFWASKMLGVVDHLPRRENVVKALTILSRP